MDLTVILVAIGLGAAILAFVALSLSGKGQSYEEAVAASRRLARDAQKGLFDDPVKKTAKQRLQQQQTKKSKKAGKKVVKEKQVKETAAAASNSESETQAESGVEEEVVHPHVEFSDTATVTVDEHPKPSKNKKKSKDKVKPILINKDDPSCVIELSTPPSPVDTEPANHFEQIHPKDEFELLHATHLVKDKPEPPKKESKNAAKAPKPDKSEKFIKQEKEIVEKTTTLINAEPPKEQRKGKNKTAQVPVVNEVDSANENINSKTPEPAELQVEKHMKSAHSIEAPQVEQVKQMLTQAVLPLINGHQQAQPKHKKKKNDNSQYQQLFSCPEGVNVNVLVQLLSEATLSRSEIQILTDCLLNKQNGPLPEHTEWTEGPKDPLQRLKKQLAEKEKTLLDEQEATKAAQIKLKELRASLNAERSRSTQIAQQCEETESNLRKDSAALQSRIQRGVDENNSLRQQILQLQNKLAAEAEWSAQHAQMEMHIKAITDKNNALSATIGSLQAENSELHEAHSVTANELHVARDHIRRLEDVRRMYDEAEMQRNNLARSEQMLKQEIRQANERLKTFGDTQAEVQRLTSAQTYAQQEAIKNEQRKEELERQNSQLISDLNLLKSEKEELNKAIVELNEKLAAQPTPNGTSTPDNKEDAISIEKAVAAACNELELRHAQQIDSLQQQLNQQKDKNNKLITKNWKVMEALQDAEKKMLQSAPKTDDNTLRETVKKICTEEQTKNRQILERLFTRVAAEGVTYDEWLSDFVGKADEVLSNVSEEQQRLSEIQSENEKLKSMMESYKVIMSDMDKSLGKLQDEANKEDQKWRSQIAEKQKELEELKEISIAKMQKEIDTLKSRLEQAEKIKDEPMNNGSNPLTININKASHQQMADVERLLEENTRLRETIEKLESSSQSQNGPAQLLPITTFEHKTSKKRRSIAGWLGRKITFRRKKPKEMRNKIKQEDLFTESPNRDLTESPAKNNNNYNNNVGPDR